MAYRDLRPIAKDDLQSCKITCHHKLGLTGHWQSSSGSIFFSEVQIIPFFIYCMYLEVLNSFSLHCAGTTLCPQAEILSRQTSTQPILKHLASSLLPSTVLKTAAAGMSLSHKPQCQKEKKADCINLITHPHITARKTKKQIELSYLGNLLELPSLRSIQSFGNMVNRM